MPLTLSPFRYFQLAQYLLRTWTDQVPRGALWKGKERAEPLLGKQTRSRLAGTGTVKASVEEREDTGASSIAGPSRLGYDPSSSPSSRKPPQLGPDPGRPQQQTEIYRLMNDERLLHPDKAKPPREVVVLCHGLYGFSTATPIPLFPSLKLHYWHSVLEVLRDQMGVNVLVVGVKGTGSIKERAEQMHAALKEQLPKGTGVNFVAHSMGGLDCRYLISNIKPTSYTPVSLTTIGTPHHGSPFMDWCAANIGVGSPTATQVAMKGAEAVAKALPYSLKSPLLARPPGSKDKKESNGFGNFTASLTSYLLNIFDSPAYANLTTSYLRDHFNPSTPDSSSVKYTSVAGRVNKLSVLHPLWFPKLVLDAAAENGYGEDSPGGIKAYLGNDGLVSVHSAQWGEFLGAVDATHHWELRGEGGLFPNMPTLRDEDGKKAKGKEEIVKEGAGWMPFDWQGDFGNGVSEHLGLAAESAKSSMASAVAKVQPSSGPLSKNGSTSTSSWDLAQVGQVLDWVTDLIPGGDNVETKKKQLADAKREKEKDEERQERALMASRQGGVRAESDKERVVRKKKEKFDLARFYGGLMLKLRDDGF